MATLIDHDGHLAVDMGWFTDWHEPKRERILYVGRMRTSDWQFLIGKTVEWTGNSGRVYDHSTEKTYYLQTDNRREWERVVIVEKVKKPRDGKYHTYKWESGQWRKIPK